MFDVWCLVFGVSLCVCLVIGASCLVFVVFQVRVMFLSVGWCSVFVACCLLFVACF